MLMKKLVATAAMTAALSMVGTAAFAHECFVVKRSQTSVENAGTKSKIWFAVNAGEVFGFIHFEGIPGVDEALTPEQVEYATQYLEDAGVPMEFAIFGGPKTIPAGNGFTGGDDGKGIDHFFSAYGDTIVEAYHAARAARPAEA